MVNLPDSYVQARTRIPDYIEAMLKAEAPDRFSQRFLERLDFKSKNDRAWIGVLKDLGFIDNDGKPLQRYYEFLDRTRWKLVLGEALKETYGDLFAINKYAHEMTDNDVKNKLRTLYQGQKSDNAIGLIAKTFTTLAELAEFEEETDYEDIDNEANDEEVQDYTMPHTERATRQKPKLAVRALEYHINIVLPETRDQTVYDAIFRSLREHLG